MENEIAGSVAAEVPQLDTSSQFGHEVWHLFDDEGGSKEPSSRGANGEVRSFREHNGHAGHGVPGERSRVVGSCRLES